MPFSLLPFPLPPLLLPSYTDACGGKGVASPGRQQCPLATAVQSTSLAMGISLTISSINCHFPPIYLFCDIFLCRSSSLSASLSLSLSLLVWLLFIVIVIVVACLYISWLCSSNCNNGVKCFTADKKFNLCENMFWPAPAPPFPCSPFPAQTETGRQPDGQINR